MLTHTETVSMLTSQTKAIYTNKNPVVTYLFRYELDFRLVSSYSDLRNILVKTSLIYWSNIKCHKSITNKSLPGHLYFYGVLTTVKSIIITIKITRCCMYECYHKSELLTKQAIINRVAQIILVIQICEHIWALWW